MLAAHEVDYLLIGGYAAGYCRYPRTTAEMDIWIRLDNTNAGKLVHVLADFGMVSKDVTPKLFLDPGNIVRIGIPPIRVEILNDIDGVSFAECAERATDTKVDGVPVRVISLKDLRANKKASGRYKDLDDIEHLPKA